MPLRVAGQDKAETRRLQRMAEQGQLRRIHSGIYTDDLTQPIEAITPRHLYELCARKIAKRIHTTFWVPTKRF